jgi:hypothetical protein
MNKQRVQKKNPPIHGIATPKSLMTAYFGPTISLILNSNPMTKRRMIAPRVAIL